jgi:hypothetical protein
MEASEILRLRTDDISWRKVGDSIVILDLASSAYLSVNGTGTLIWDRLTQGATMDQLIADVLAGFEVDEPQARKDIETFVESLRTRSLIA